MLFAVKILEESHRKIVYHRTGTNSPMDKLTSYFINNTLANLPTSGLNVYCSLKFLRYIFMTIVILIAFIVNTLAGRLLEYFKCFIQRQFVQDNDGFDGLTIVLGFVFEFINLIFTAVLSWIVYDIGRKVFEEI